VRNSIRIGLVIALGSLSMATPILISLELAWRESVSYEKGRVADYARDAVRRSDEVGDQLEFASQQLSTSRFSPCSAQEVDLMRRLDVGSTYLQAIGRISGNYLLCSSLGTTQPIDLGSPTLVTESGSQNRLNAHLPLTGGRPITIVTIGSFAFLLDANLPLDTATEGPDVSLGLFVPSQLGTAFVAGQGHIRPEWCRTIPKGTAATFLDNGYVVSVARSAQGDIASVAAAPQTYVTRHLRHFARTFVPLGVLCGCALAWAVVFVSRAQLSLPSLLRTAAKRCEFFVEYQPIVDLQSRRWIGAEALVRWHRGTLVVGPDSFIPAAEESGIVTSITACVADIVAADLPGMLKLDPAFCVSMNFSAQDLRNEATLNLLSRVLQLTGAGPGNLQVEVTEGGFLHGPQSTELCRKVRALGVTLAIDDFGTGYSSLARLEVLAPDVLKIDKSFVDTIGTDCATSQVVPHIIQIGHSLRLKLVAEGVETPEQAEFLRLRGVHYAQGWLFGKPMSIRRFHEAFLAQCAPEHDAAAHHQGVTS
jgi:sensor c-di-GMP phosphodiesterase-like protein